MNEEQPESQPHQTNLFIGPEGLRAGWSLLLYLALLAILFFAMRFLSAHTNHAPRTTTPHEQTLHMVYLGEIIPFLLVAFATWIMSRIERRPAGTYGLGGTRKLSRFLGGVGWGIVFLSLLVITLKITGLLVFDSRLLHGATILHYGALWIGGFLLVALFEEYLMRGYLQFILARGLAAIYEVFAPQRSQPLGFWTAAFLLSFLFGLGHGSNPGESPIGLLAAGIVGLVFCLSLWRTGSLWWAIGFHASWDWAQSFLYGVADSGTMVQFHLFTTHHLGRPILSGGATGPEGSIFILPLMALIAAVILLTLPQSTASR